MAMHQIRFPVLTVRETVQPARLPDVRDAALSEITRIAREFQGPDDDVRPFLLLGNDEGVHSITPAFPDDVSLPFDEQLAMFIEQIGPMVLTQKEATCAAFVVTVWTAPGGARGQGPRASDRPDKQEAVTVMLADALGAEETLIAPVDRHRFKPATVGEFRLLSDRVQPTIAEALRRGFLGYG
jgi:hypothetical protein